MFDFIKKAELWEAFGADWYDEVKGRVPFHLKTIQDVIVYQYVKDVRHKYIAEIGGGNSRILPLISANNECCNVEKFEGADGGPISEIKIPNVRNIKTFVGEYNDLLEDNYFDILFSISVIEHVPNDKLEDFFEDCIRILKPGGIMIHAIDIYVTDTPSSYWLDRFGLYQKFLIENNSIEPMGSLNRGSLKFECDFATNPDDVMYSWGRIAPDLDGLRQVAQSVSLKWGARKL